MARRPNARERSVRDRVVRERSIRFDDKLVRPLAGAENYFLEVLLDQFRIERHGTGVELRVRFSGDTPAVWGRQGVRHVNGLIPEFGRRAPALQRKLDACLLDGTLDRYAHNDPTFPFRYASGGTLPIVRRAKKDYFCLFYRDIYPVGWNIANGGCDSREELRNPLEAAEREFREELMILNPLTRRWQVFGSDADTPIDWPEFSVARNLWANRLRLNLPDLMEQRVPLMWLVGPDRLVVDTGDAPPNSVDGCYVNITAGDFGIEIDRIARLSIDEDSVLLDGELHNRHLINAPVGLFEVGRLTRELAKGSQNFVPDHLFHGGRYHDGGDVERVIKEDFLPELGPIRTEDGRRSYADSRHKLDLCPVTRGIVARYQLPKPVRQGGGRGYDLFISFGGEDRVYAKTLYDYFHDKRIHAFFSDESLHESNFLRQIDAALDQARYLIAVATRAERLRRQWVQWELDRFQCDILSGIKGDGQMLAFVAGVQLRDLPGRLRANEVITFDPKNPAAALARIEKFVK